MQYLHQLYLLEITLSAYEKVFLKGFNFNCSYRLFAIEKTLNTISIIVERTNFL